jgi:hypothetical protein
VGVIPTRVVKYRGGNGDSVVINASDFDPDKHIPADEPEAKTSGDSLDSTPRDRQRTSSRKGARK